MRQTLRLPANEEAAQGAVQDRLTVLTADFHQAVAHAATNAPHLVSDLAGVPHDFARFKGLAH